MSGLYPHQLAGAEWIAGRKRAYLGDTMGLGKTRTIIAGLQRTDVRKPLIVCPAIARSHWRREFGAMGWDREEPVILSYHGVVTGGEFRRDYTLDVDKVDALVLDEAHYLKNLESQRTRLLLGANGYWRRLGRLWAVSGTPMPRNPAELYPVLVRLAPEVLVKHGVGQYKAWVERFCVSILRTHNRTRRNYTKIIGSRNEEELKQILAHVMLRRTLRDTGLALPPLVWQTITLDTFRDLSGADQRTDAELQEMLARGVAPHALPDNAETAKLRHEIGRLKVEPFMRMILDEMERTDEKVVIFAHHRDVLRHVSAKLIAAGFKHIYVDGDTPDRQRDAAVEAFQTQEKWRAFVGQGQACQTSLTLTASSRVINLEPYWDSSTNVQLAYRVARIGQTAPHCLAQLVVLAGTIDEAVVRQNEREMGMVARVIGLES